VKTFPFVTVYIPWFAMIVCEIALFVLLWKSTDTKRYRGFEAYITTTVTVSLLLFVVSLAPHPSYYTAAYYLGALVKTLALAAAVLEQYRIQFFPRWSMSARVFKLLMSALGAIVVGSIAVVAFTPQETPLWDLAWARRMVSLSDYMLCGSMGLLLIYGELLHVQRPQRAQSIVRGLIATGVLGVTASLMLAVAGTARLGGVVGYSTTIGFVAVLISWIVAFRKPDVVTELDGTSESPLDLISVDPSPRRALANEMLIYKV
jgi:hypothetical protein